MQININRITGSKIKDLLLHSHNFEHPVHVISLHDQPVLHPLVVHLRLELYCYRSALFAVCFKNALWWLYLQLLIVFLKMCSVGCSLSYHVRESKCRNTCFLDLSSPDHDRVIDRGRHYFDMTQYPELYLVGNQKNVESFRLHGLQRREFKSCFIFVLFINVEGDVLLNVWVSLDLLERVKVWQFNRLEYCLSRSALPVVLLVL